MDVNRTGTVEREIGEGEYLALAIINCPASHRDLTACVQEADGLKVVISRGFDGIDDDLTLADLVGGSGGSARVGGNIQPGLRG